MKIFSLFFLAFLILSSCSDSEDPNPDAVYIRIENNSLHDFSDLIVRSNSSPVEFGTVPSGTKSNYKVFEKAYRYGMVQLKADGDEFKIIPFDYVGETPLTNGYYTYKLSLQSREDGTKFLTMELVVE